MEEYKSFGTDDVTATGLYGTGRIKFKENSSFIVCGRSGSGKTTFISKLLLHAPEVFENKNGRALEILYCYSSYQPLFDHMKANIPSITFHKNLPDEELLEQKLKPEKKHLILVVDDLMDQVLKSKLIYKFFTIRAHHEGCSIIYVSHNLFQQGEFAKTINVNAGYICLFQNPRGADQIMTISKQMFPGKNNVVAQAFNVAMLAQRFGYLVIDNTPNVPQELMLRTCVFPSQVTRFYWIGSD